MSTGSERLDNGDLELYNLDVGQADATVMITEEGQIVLNDADEEEVVDELETVLADRSVERTENGNIPLVFAATHFHQDHIKGLENLSFHDYEVSHAIYPNLSRIEILDDGADKSDKGINENNIKDFKNNLDRLGVEKYTEVSYGDIVPIDSTADLTVLSPPDADGSVDVIRPETGATVNFRAKQPNENGAVYKLESGRSALFMGDVQMIHTITLKVGSCNNTTIQRTMCPLMRIYYWLVIMDQAMRPAKSSSIGSIRRR